MALRGGHKDVITTKSPFLQKEGIHKLNSMSYNPNFNYFDLSQYKASGIHHKFYNWKLITNDTY